LGVSGSTSSRPSAFSRSHKKARRSRLTSFAHRIDGRNLAKELCERKITGVETFGNSPNLRLESSAVDIRAST
jgi:hypothetical protein